MKTKYVSIMVLAGLMVAGLTVMSWADSPKMKMTTPIPPEITTPDKVETRLGTLKAKYGMPDQDSIDKVYGQLDLARAVDVFLNTQGGISLYSFRKGMRDIGVSDHTLMTAETMTDSTGMFLTPNTVTPQTYTFLNLDKGPVVMEVPPNILGLVDDMWFRYVADIGLMGPDKGKGGKYLFVPPDYKGDLPESGYFVFKSATYGLFVGFRNFAVKGDVKAAIDSMRQHTRIYSLSEADAAHKELPNKNTSFAQINTVQPNTYLYWEYLNKLIQEEPAGAFGSEVTGQIAAIGIEKGKPFKPDARMKKILEEGVAIGNITARAITFDSRDDASYFYGKESAWFTPFNGGYAFESNGGRKLDGRTTFYYFATGITPAMEQKKVGQGSQYAVAAKDSKGSWFDGGKTYKLTLPAKIPHKNFWSATIYDTQTRSMLQSDYPYPAVGGGKGFVNANKPNYGDIKVNPDGSTDIYFGPKSPKGKESNWIQTVPERGWFVMFRLYNPLQPWFDKTWRPGEIELVK